MNNTLITARQHSLQLVALTPADLSDLMPIEQAAHSHPWSEKLLLSALARHRCWGVKTDDQWLGFAIVSLVVGEAELLDFVVTPACQGQGVGTAFISWLIKQLAPQAERFYLEVRESNAAAIALYEAAGFVEVGVRRNYYPAAKGREDALLMAMELFE